MDLRFPGQWFQSESGLHQNWMRDYDPGQGRYIQADPLGLVDGASVYGYALQNPGRYVDPTGELVPFFVFAVGVGIGSYVDYQLEKCGCDSWGAMERWAGLGAAWAEYGPTIGKHNAYDDGRSRRIGRSSGTISRMSKRVTKQYPGGKPGSFNQQYRHGARNGGKAVWRKVPYIGAAFALLDGYRLAKCWGYI